MGSLMLTEKRVEVLEIMRQTINRPNGGRSIVYDIPAGLGKTKAMLRVIAERLVSGTGDVILAAWQSTNQMLDAVGVGLPNVELRDCARDMPKDWHIDDGVSEYVGIPGLLYRGKEQVCEMTDKTRSCWGCPLYNSCPYTWQKKLLSMKVLRVVFGTHALLKGEPAFYISAYLGRVDHVVVDENNNAFIIEVTLTHEQLRRVMLMCAWQLGHKGYKDLPPAVAGIAGVPQETCFTARQQASAILDAFNTLRNEGKAYGDWLELRALLYELVNDPEIFDDSTDEGADALHKHRVYLNETRADYGDKEAHLEPGSQMWREGARACRDLLALIDRLLDPDELRKLVRVDPGKKAGHEPSLYAAWRDIKTYFVGSNQLPADMHYLDATPYEIVLKYWLGFFNKDKFEYQRITVPEQNVDLTIYASLSTFNKALKLMTKQILHVCNKLLKEHGGELLLVLPTLELAGQYRTMFRNRPEIHVSHIQVLPGVNLYEQCQSVVIAGNYLPGGDGLADAVTMLYGRPMSIRRAQDPSKPLTRLPPGPPGADLRKTMEFGHYMDVHLQDVADAHIGDSIWQAIARTRPLDKPQPVKAVYIGNYALPEYLQKMERTLNIPIKFGDLKKEMGLRRHKLTVSEQKVRGLVDVFGGFIIDYSWLKLRNNYKGKPLFADYEQARYFMGQVDCRQEMTPLMQSLFVELGLMGYTIPVGLGQPQEVFGVFASQEEANNTMGEFKASFEEFQRKQLEACIVNRTALGELIVKLIRSYPRSFGKLYSDVVLRKEFKLFPKSELQEAMRAELDILLNNGQISLYNQQYRKS